MLVCKRKLSRNSGRIVDIVIESVAVTALAYTHNCHVLKLCLGLKLVPDSLEASDVFIGIDSANTVALALEPVNSAADDLVLICHSRIVFVALCYKLNGEIGALGIGRRCRPTVDRASVLTCACALLVSALMPYENVLYGIARSYALCIELCEKGTVESLCCLSEIIGSSCAKTSAAAPPICGAEGVGDIRGSIGKMVARVTLTHNNDQIELCLLYRDLNGSSGEVDGCVTDFLSVEIGGSLGFDDLDSGAGCDAYARIGGQNAFDIGEIVVIRKSERKRAVLFGFGLGLGCGICYRGGVFGSGFGCCLAAACIAGAGEKHDRAKREYHKFLERFHKATSKNFYILIISHKSLFVKGLLIFDRLGADFIAIAEMKLYII